MIRRLIDVKELSEYSGIRVSTIYSWVSQGKIPFVKMGRRTLFDLRKIDEYIEEMSREVRKTSARVTIDL